MKTEQKWKIGDCLDLLPEIPDKSINLVFADPPYNLMELDAFVDVAVYRKWSSQYFNEIKRILKWNGTFIISGRPPVLCQLVTDLIDIGFVFREWITWHKVDSITPTKEYHSHNYECFAIFSKWIERIFNYIPVVSKTKNYSSERNLGSIWEHCKISSQHKEGTKHPTQKPLKFLERFILTYTNEFDTVLDPFLGSGTTLEACMNTNRNCIGFEINPQWESIYRKRLKIDNTKIGDYEHSEHLKEVEEWVKK